MDEHAVHKPSTMTGAIKDFITHKNLLHATHTSLSVSKYNKFLSIQYLEEQLFQKNEKDGENQQAEGYEMIPLELLALEKAHHHEGKDRK